ncbi:Rieske (2Fe-2S) protein [Streptomyces sp. NPDC049040]|uniref:Rieske (2Fe-2S) protein n=1 Tax=Streptomyces sp. NPDC049040 TaxID=3365593 RepID=UPI00371F59B4
MRSPVDRYVARLLSGRRPKAFAASEEDIAQVRAVIELLEHRTERALPAEAFVTRLRYELAAGQSRTPTPHTPTTALRRRRRFVRAGLVGAAAFGTGLVTEPLLPLGSGAGAGQARPEPEVRPTRGTWHTLASSAQVPEGAVMDFDLGSLAGYVHRTAGRLQSVSATCTHQACRLDLDAARSMLVCPCHGASFTLAGAPQPGTTYRAHGSLPPLPRIPVRERLGRIEIYAPAPIPPAEA